MTNAPDVFSPLGNRARDLFESGFNCAESMLRAIMERCGGDAVAARAATALGGGGGRSFAGECGIYTGGLLALGLMHGRDVPGADWDRLAALCAAWRESFQDLAGTTLCPALLTRFEGQTNMAACKLLTAQAATSFETLLTENAPPAAS